MAQEPPAPPEPVPPDSAPSPVHEGASPVQEVGGRLVITSETVVVKGNPDQRPLESSIGTKIDTPLLETPRSVSILDRRMLDDVAVINISQSHDYTVGLFPLDERGPGSARGFPISFYDLRRDGLRTFAWSVREPAVLDRIQYLRGSASVLYGDGSPGGLVNLVLKKPLPVPRFELTASGGELGFGRVTADAAGPLTSDRSVRYRLVGAGEWLDNGIDNRERRVTVMPALAVDLGRRATLSFDTEFYDQRGRNYRHVVPATSDTQRGDFSRLPWDLSIASPDDGWTGRNVAPGIRLDVGLGAGASIHVGARYTKIDGDLDVQALLGLSADGRTANRYHYREISTWREYQSDSFATLTAWTGSIEHRLVAGVEAGFSTTDSRIGIGPAPSLDIYDPQYGPHPPDPDLQPIRNDVLRIGTYILDQVRLRKWLIVTPSLRWSRLDVDDHIARSLSSPTSPSQEASSSTNDMSPSIGVVVLPRTWLSLYMVYAQGFEPPAPGQYLENGRAPAPTENGSIEAGIKVDFADRRLGFTAAGYRIRQSNVAEADPRGFYRQIGEGESHGLELELVGVVRKGLLVNSGYAWTETEITHDASGFAGRELPNAPHHKANLWVQYRLPPGRFMLGAGVVHVSDRFTGRNNIVLAPAYTRVDATARYELAGPRLAVGLTAENLSNRRYVTSGAGQVLFAGRPRRIAVQLTAAF